MKIVLISVPITHVIAVVNDPAYLPCDISTRHNGDSVQLVLWYRDDLDESVYSVDARDRDFGIAERWSDETVFSNRAYFIDDKKPAQLAIDRVHEKDSGVYRCRVDFLIGQTRNSKVNLTVIIPPHKILITDENGIVRNSRVGPYLESDDLELNCDVYGGKPLPLVSWYLDKTLITNESIILRPGVLRSTIVIKNLERRDIHTELICISNNNNNKTIPITTKVRIDMNFSPLYVKIIGQNKALSADKRYDIVCVTYGSRPPALVTWWRDDERLIDSNETSSSDGNVTTSVLSFIPNKTDTKRKLICRSENTAMSSGPIDDEWILEINYKPETRIQLGTSLDKNTIREGTDVYFDCLTSAQPSVYRVEWRHNNNILGHNIHRGIIISNQSLVLQGVERSSAGNYTCVGFNIEGDGESLPFNLNVMFTPTCKPNQTKIHGVAKQEKAFITCQVDANPMNVEFHWTFNNSAESINVASGHIGKSGTKSVVSYTPMTELDYGTLLCWAKNNIGSQLVPCVYHIIPAGHPDMVHNCTTRNTSINSFSIRCTEGFNGGLQQSFLIEVRESHSQELKYNSTSPIPQFRVGYLDPGKLYHACIYAYNEKGRSEAMVIQAGTLRLPEKQHTTENGKTRDRPRHHVKLTPMLSIMIGVFAALLIVAVIVIIVLRIQNGNSDNHGKPHIEDLNKTTKTIPIQRELRFREGLVTDEKHVPNTYTKTRESNGELSEGDDKNPDIIPQKIMSNSEEHQKQQQLHQQQQQQQQQQIHQQQLQQHHQQQMMDYARKRRLQAVSTIDTSPSRVINEQSSGQPASLGYYPAAVSYCTMRRDIPMREWTALPSTKHVNFQPMMMTPMYSSGVCTLPRQHWPAPSNRHSMSMSMTMTPQPILYSDINIVRTCPSGTILTNDYPTTTTTRIPLQRCVQTSLDSNTSMSSMTTSTTTTTVPTTMPTTTKRESSV
ncbi:hypothetical protein HCN44_009594 [Aphidius gifuensis]|uniref:Nephrin n=1 Tax=Aphidius gifuensis TaxID=684658 RepID=A0A834Y4Z5_APHGI|nr:hypothetical protein HCN44_009594 [Aphidius gifuensis]